MKILCNLRIRADSHLGRINEGVAFIRSHAEITSHNPKLGFYLKVCEATLMEQ